MITQNPQEKEINLHTILKLASDNPKTDKDSKFRFGNQLSKAPFLYKVKRQEKQKLQITTNRVSKKAGELDG